MLPQRTRHAVALLVSVAILLLQPVTARAAEPPLPYGPVPSERQLRWHELEFYGFLHFTVNTFTDKEWGYGDEPPSDLQPDGLRRRPDRRRGEGGGHEGPHPHREAPRRLLPLAVEVHRALREEQPLARRQGRRRARDLRRLPPPRPRASASTSRPGTATTRTTAGPPTSTTTASQLRELLTGYGPIFEVWFDGANGGDGYYGGAREKRTIDRRTYYDWPDTWQIVRDLQPGAVMFSDVGPDVRWVGNEKGIAGDPCWATLNRDDFAPGEADEARLNRGDRPGTHWLPAECDVSIRPGWFYHAAEDDKVKTPRELLDLYYESVGRGASLLPQPPAGPARAGSTRTTCESLREFRRAARRHLRHRPRPRRPGDRQQRARRRRPLRRRRTSWTASATPTGRPTTG